MKVYKVVTVHTDDQKETVSVNELIGEQAPFAMMINHNSQGYGKFIIDDKSLDAFEQRLSDIECRLTRKQIYNILFDMIKSGHIAASRVIKIIKTHIV